MAIFCDESGISGTHKYYGFGALLMKYQRRGQFAAEIEEIRNRHRYGGEEIKWNHASPAKVGLYRAIIDYFFDTSWLRFHAMIVERSWVDVRQFHDGSYDLARRKHFTKFLSNKVTGIVTMNPGRDLDFIVYADPIASAYPKAGEAVEIISNRSVRKELTLPSIARGVDYIRKVIEVDSKERNGIQLCDLLLGALTDAWNDQSSSTHKAFLKQHLASHVSWPDLLADTLPTERKFNIWMLTDKHKSGQRPVKTRPVRLRHPLPPIRQYKPGRSKRDGKES